MFSPSTVQITGRLYDARATMKRLFPDNFTQHIADYRVFIENIMRRDSSSSLEALTVLLKELQARQGDTGFAQLWLMATCVEMSEEQDKKAAQATQQVK